MFHLFRELAYVAHVANRHKIVINCVFASALCVRHEEIWEEEEAWEASGDSGATVGTCLQLFLYYLLSED